MIIVRTLPLPEQGPTYSSGVVGQDIVDTVRIIETAVRRCGKSPATLTAEDLGNAKTNLHLILSSLSNRGLNLWAVDRLLLPLVHGQAAYTMPIGTEKVVNAKYREACRMPVASIVESGHYDCSVATLEVVAPSMFGFKLPTEFQGDLSIEFRATPNGPWELYRNFNDIELNEGWHWYEFDPALRCAGVRIRDTGNRMLTVTDIGIFNNVQDRDFSEMNRDLYTSLPAKSRTGRPNSYYFDKQINPQMMIWPTPESEEAQIVLWRQRRIHDVGSLAHKLEVPERWLESITWSLAKNLAYELTGVPAERMTLCAQEAANALRDAELGEGDDAPLYIMPNISGYTA